jgi:hypothetical protein
MSLSFESVRTSLFGYRFPFPVPEDEWPLSMKPLALMILGIAVFVGGPPRFVWFDPWRALIGLLIVAVSVFGARRPGSRGLAYWLGALAGSVLLASAFIPPVEAGDANEYLAGEIGLLCGGLCIVLGLIALVAESQRSNQDTTHH